MQILLNRGIFRVNKGERMNKRTLGIFIQVIGLVLWIFLPIEVAPWKGALGIIMIITGGVVFRLGRKEDVEKTGESKKSAPEKFLTIVAVLICGLIIGLILLIAIPNFIKGYKEAKQQSQQN